MKLFRKLHQNKVLELFKILFKKCFSESVQI